MLEQVLNYSSGPSPSRFNRQLTEEEKRGLFLTHVKQRNPLIQEIVDENSHYRPIDQKVTQITRFLVNGILFFPGFAIDITVEDKEYLTEASELANKTRKVMVMSNHQTDADHPIKRAGLEHCGFGSFADRLVYLSGLNMISRPYIAPFVGSENTLLIATPHELQLTIQYLEDPALDSSQKAELMQFQGLCRQLNDKSMREMRRLMTYQGLIPAFYPEAGRSRDLQGRMTAIHPYMSSHFRRDGWIVPIVTWGPHETFPPEQTFKFQRFSVHMRVGKPFNSSELWREGANRKDPAEQAICGQRVYNKLISLNLALHNPDLPQTDES